MDFPNVSSSQTSQTSAVAQGPQWVTSHGSTSTPMWTFHGGHRLLKPSLPAPVWASPGAAGASVLTVNLHVLQWGMLLYHGLHHGLQGISAPALGAPLSWRGYFSPVSLLCLSAVTPVLFVQAFLILTQVTPTLMGLTLESGSQAQSQLALTLLDMGKTSSSFHRSQPLQLTPATKPLLPKQSIVYFICS